MASEGGRKTPRRRQRHHQLFESRREREFYRYYEPIRALSESGPAWTDLNDSDAVKAHRPFSSPDKALTAFCQLGALRLAARRAMLFFFDSNYAYILAEATRSLSLQDDSVHEIEDHLWLGHTVIPRGFSVCEHTVNLPANLGSNRDAKESAEFVHVINDLREDTRFCNRPYVTDEPNARFYAGVPITTPKGINIGAYCILDDRVREGVTEKETAFLKDMAATVMSHLDHVRAKAEHQRGTRMVTGLGAFVEGASSFKDWATQSDVRDRQFHSDSLSKGTRTTQAFRVPERLQSPVNAQMGGSVPAEPTELLDHTPEAFADVQQMPSAISPPTQSEHSPTDHTRLGALSPPERTASAGSGLSKISQTKHVEDIQEEALTTNVRATFRRAACLIREAVDVEGSLFLDATIGSFGGLVQGPDSTSGVEQNSGSEEVNQPPGDGSEADEGLALPPLPKPGHSDKPCIILGASHGKIAGLQEGSLPDHEIAAKDVTVAESFLRSLLRRYPHGKVWNFNEDGYASDEGSSSEGTTRRTRKPSISPPRTRPNTSESSATESSTRKKRRQRTRVEDAREIQKLFPGVRSLALVGIWDHVRRRWYAANIVWTYSAMRVLSVEAEMTYMAAFCDVVMAEISRLDAQSADRAKSDFISSISHELRSPMHGILGSVECLQDQPSLDSFNAGLLGQIETCGRTLLDIIDHLLDFSKINFYAQRDANKPSEAAKMATAAKKDKQKLNGMMAMDVDVSLDSLTEEVVETAVYSFCCSRDKEYLDNRNVTVILDIDRACETRWGVYLRTGAYKRICINLVSNALKYTAEGYVLVSLRASPIPNKKKKFNAILTVTDSGRGMSKDFLESELFRAFSQEDSLVEGTGLGMSLVSKIIKANGGKIEVRSQKGVGTTASVILPLEYSRRKGDEGLGEVCTPPQRPFSGLSIGLIGFADILPAGLAPGGQISSTETARSLLQTTLRKTLSDLGVESHLVGWSVSADVDVYLITEVDLAEMREHVRRMQLVPNSATSIQIFVAKPLIVLCDTAMSARKLRSAHLKDMVGSRIAYISQPIGPVGLTKALRECQSLEPPEFSNAVQQATKAWVSPATTNSSPERDQVQLQPLPSRPGLPLRRRTTQTRSAAFPGPDLAHTRPPTSRQETVLITPLLFASPHSRPQAQVAQEEGFPFPHTIQARNQPALPGASERPEFATRDTKLIETPLIAHEAPLAPPKASLLLVDDNRINLQLLITYADKYRHPKLTAMDGLQAVEVYKSACHRSTLTAAINQRPMSPSASKPDVVLMDINMPVLNGFEATRRIRAFEQQNNLKPAVIIALTGLGSADAQKEAYGSGVNLFLTKPVRLKELTKVLEEARTR